MKLPILAYGHPVLRQKCEDIPRSYPKLKQLISDMWETLYAANGAGLAAPQIGKAIRLFIVDTVQDYRNSSIDERKMFITDKGIRETFINPVILEKGGSLWVESEGCLSIPKLQFDIERKLSVAIKYYDENFEEKEGVFSGVTARAVLHEYDHIEGVLFTDYVNEDLYREQVDKISRGDVKVKYRMKFFK